MNWRETFLWQYPEGYHSRDAKGLEEVLGVLREVNHGDLTFINNVISLLQNLPQEYADRVYAKVYYYNSLYPEMLLKNPSNIKENSISLSHVAVDDTYSNDVGVLGALAERFGVNIKYSYSYAYVAFESKT